MLSCSLRVDEDVSYKNNVFSEVFVHRVESKPQKYMQETFWEQQI